MLSACKENKSSRTGASNLYSSGDSGMKNRKASLTEYQLARQQCGEVVNNERRVK